MSQEEDLELKELVTEALEKNGVLADIRARLRSNIFMTLEHEHQQKHQNNKLKELITTQEGIFSLLLIQELLEYCNLIQTSSVFKAESGQGKSYIYEGRHTLLDKLKCNNLSDKYDLPVLVQLVKIFSNVKNNIHNENANNIDTSNESLNVNTQNNTFLVNSGRSDNYDLSFASESDGSISIEDKNKVILPLNLNNSSDSSDSLSTEVQGNNNSNSNSLKSDDSSIKQDESIHEQSESARIVSEILLNESSKDESLSSSDNASPKSEVEEFIKSNIQNSKDDSKKNSGSKSNSSITSYSKYLNEKNKTLKINNESNAQINDIPPIDNVMKHFINSRISRSDSTSDESLSEEIIQAFENSEKNNGYSTENSVSLVLTSQEKSVKIDSITSPVRNLLDETLQESPKTKELVNEQVKLLKEQSLIKTNIEIVNNGDKKVQRNLLQKSVKSNGDETTKVSVKSELKKDVSVKNEKNKLNNVMESQGNDFKSGLSTLSDLPPLVSDKNIKILPPYSNQSDKIVQGVGKGILADNINEEERAIKDWKDS